MGAIKTWLIAIGGLLAAIIGIFYYGKKSGKDAARAKQNKKVLNDIAKSKKAADRSDSLSVDQQLNELRDDIKK